jgi:hypothetical protein
MPSGAAPRIVDDACASMTTNVDRARRCDAPIAVCC